MISLIYKIGQLFNKTDFTNFSFKTFHFYIITFFLILNLVKCSVENNLKQNNHSPPSSVNNVDYYKAMNYYYKSTFEDYNIAQNYFERAISKNPTFAIAYAMLSITNSRIGQYFFYKNQIKKANYYYYLALNYAIYSLRLNSKLSKGYLALALYSRQIQNSNELVKYALKAIEINPNEHEAYAVLGDGYNCIFFDKYDNNKSIEYYKKSLSISPKFIPSRYNLALLYYFSKDYKESIKHLEEAIKINSNIDSFYYYLSLSYKEINECQKAIYYIQKAIGLSSANPYYYDLKGQIFFQMKNTEKAILFYEKAININSNIPQFFINKGIAYKQIKDYENSIDSYKKAIEIKPNYDLPHYELAIMFEIIKNYESAIKEYLIFYKLSNNDYQKKLAKEKIIKLFNFIKKVKLKNID